MNECMREKAGLSGWYHYSYMYLTDGVDFFIPIIFSFSQLHLTLPVVLFIGAFILHVQYLTFMYAHV